MLKNLFLSELQSCNVYIVSLLGANQMSTGTAPGTYELLKIQYLLSANSEF